MTNSELYANYEHLLAVEKTSKDEQVNRGKAVIEEDYKRLDNLVNDLARKNAELEARLNVYDTKFEELKERLVKLSE
jgi:hypothetical protein